MMNWLRRVDPAFYHKEPRLLQTAAQIPRYVDDEQVAVRLEVLAKDRLLHVASAIVALGAFALMTIPATWTRTDGIILLVALIVAVALYRLRGRPRTILAVAAIGAFFGVHAHPVSIAPLVGILAACASVVGTNVVVREWRIRPQVLTWATFALMLVVCAYTIVLNASAVALHLPAEMAIAAVAYLAVCIIAGRVRRAELLARPDGVLSLPQSIVPLLERSHDHAIICWLV
jgi:hypothetical protein